MTKEKVSLFFAAMGIVVLTSGWLDAGFSKRTAVDVDHFRHPAGKPVLLTIDAARMEKASGEKFAPDTVKLGYVDDSGKESAVSFAASDVDKVDNKLRLSFVMPFKKGKMYLYFGGKGAKPTLTYPNLLPASLDAARYKGDGFMTASKIAAGMKIKQNKFTAKKESDARVEQIVAIAPEYAGIPVTMLFDARSNSKAMWPLAISVFSMDGAKKILNQKVFDNRWSMVQTVPEKEFHQRLEGKIDPAAKFMRVSLVACRAGEERPYDVFGHPLADIKTSLPDMDISSFKIIPGYPATLPGANGELYTEGVAKGTSALKFAGKTSVLYNNFSAL